MHDFTPDHRHRYRDLRNLFRADPPGIGGQVIVAEEHNNLMGTEHVVFLDKGSADGLAPGRSTVGTFVDNTCTIVSGLGGSCDRQGAERRLLRLAVEEEPLGLLGGLLGMFL